MIPPALSLPILVVKPKVLKISSLFSSLEPSGRVCIALLKVACTSLALSALDPITKYCVTKRPVPPTVTVLTTAST